MPKIGQRSSSPQADTAELAALGWRHFRPAVEASHSSLIDYRWWPQAELLASERVHPNSRAYLQSLRRHRQPVD